MLTIQLPIPKKNISRYKRELEVFNATFKIINRAKEKAIRAIVAIVYLGPSETLTMNSAKRISAKSKLPIPNTTHQYRFSNDWLSVALITSAKNTGIIMC